MVISWSNMFNILFAKPDFYFLISVVQAERACPLFFEGGVFLLICYCALYVMVFFDNF